MLEIPAVLRNKAAAVGAARWIDELPGLVAALSEEWSLQVGPSFPNSTESYVTAVELADGTPAVLKLMIRCAGDAARNEIAVLRLAGGEGCPQLYRHDAARGAMLLERLGRSLFELALPVERRHEILCAAAARIWRPAPGAGLPTGADKGKWLSEFIVDKWEALDRPCSERAVDYALACALRRIEAHDPGTAVLVHGDVHQWNAIESADGFKLVDPDGLLAEAEYDLGIIMREDPVELLVGDPMDRARRLAAATGLDADAAWDWGVVERVSTGLLCTEVDLQPVGREMLTAADRVAV